MPVINPSVIDSWTELTKVKPAAVGDIIELQSYYAGNKYGGGKFVARAGSAADDGGTICPVAGASFYWERIIQDANNLDVTHFGAVRDGKTDCATAVLRMIAWCDKKGAPFNNIGCQFPAGRFSIGNIDLSAKERSSFRFVGKPVLFGYFPSTIIYLDGNAKLGEDSTVTGPAPSAPALLVNARKTEVGNLIIDGRTDITPNDRGFLKNVTPGGEFVHASYWRAQNVGGIVFDLLDTLDTRFEEFYVTNCQHSVIRNYWSGQAWGKWDHTTAVELSNFNIQNCRGPHPVLDMPRCTQSHLTNGWIEHCDNPGDFSNGGWVIDGLSVEDCKNPFEMTGAMISSRAINLQSGSSIEYNNPAISEFRPYERGRVQQESHGIRSFGSLAYNYLHSNLRFKNDTAAPQWILVGTYRSVEINDQIKFRVSGSGDNGGVSLLSTPGSDNFGGGQIEVSLRRPNVKDARQEGAATVTGKCPVSDIAFDRPWENDVSIYIQLPPNSGWVNCFIETTAHSRFTNGTPFFWTYKGTIVSDDDFAKLKPYRPRSAMTLGTMNHGIGIMEDGSFSLKTRPLTSDGKLVINLNGIYHTVPVEKAPFYSDCFMRTAPLSGRALDNGLGGLFDGKWGNWGVNGGANTKDGVLSLIQKSKCSVGMDTTLTDVEVQFKLLTGPANVTDALSTSFEFRRSNWNADTTAYVLSFLGKDSDGFNKLALFRRDVKADKTFTLTKLNTNDIRCSDNQVLKVNASGKMIRLYADSALLTSVEDDVIETGTYVGFGMWDNNRGMTITDFKVSQDVKK